MNRFLSVILLLILVSSCSSQLDEQLAYALELSKDNRPELEKVIDHYAACPQKQEAARWLIANMPGHSCISNEAIKAFADTLILHPMTKAEGNRLWDSLDIHSRPPRNMKDILCINSDFLIKDIDKAFEVWENSPWHDEIDFDLFRNYILPYRADGELLRLDWRDSLNKKYAPIVSDVKNAKEAFQRIKKIIHARNQNWSYKFKYLLDPVAQNNYVSGVCIERCIYLTNVCRAVGLPVVIDNVGKWTNYSDSSHSWVALVLKDGTYTIVDDDSIARKDNLIDAATFNVHQSLPGNYPYSPMLKKRYAKIWRSHFYYDSNSIAPQFGQMAANYLQSPFMTDVSAQYGLHEGFTVSTNMDVGHIWLCIHSLQTGWIPAAYEATKNKKTEFKNISDSVLFLPMSCIDGEIRPVGYPFYVDENNNLISFIPDKSKRITVTINRKYPLIARWINRYLRIKDAIIEGSNDSQFISHAELGRVSTIPVFHNVINFSNTTNCRYVRLNSETQKKLEIAQINILDKDGNIICSSTEPVIDLGQSKEISGIEFFPRNDGNFVVPGHDYELAYWNWDKWETISRLHSEGYSLTFDSIPRGALLILHDLTEGKEERPFTINNGRQIWW